MNFVCVSQLQLPFYTNFGTIVFSVMWNGFEINRYLSIMWVFIESHLQCSFHWSSVKWRKEEKRKNLRISSNFLPHQFFDFPFTQMKPVKSVNESRFHFSAWWFNKLQFFKFIFTRLYVRALLHVKNWNSFCQCVNLNNFNYTPLASMVYCIWDRLRNGRKFHILNCSTNVTDWITQMLRR